MKCYDFELSFKLPGINADGEQYLDALYEAGCDDAMIGVGRKGYISADFSRESTSLDSAVESAIRDVESAIPGARLISAGPDLVGISDIAAILECSQQPHSHFPPMPNPTNRMNRLMHRRLSHIKQRYCPLSPAQRSALLRSCGTNLYSHSPATTPADPSLLNSDYT